MLSQQQIEVTNPYWDEVAPHVQECRWEWDKGHYEVGNPLDQPGTPESYRLMELRYELVGKYSWTIPDPSTLMFVEAFSTGKMVDPMAGTGYWAYLLGQIGVDVACYDLEPGTNHWHKDRPLWAPVAKAEGHISVTWHPDRALLLAWPPYSLPTGYDILRAYQGNRVVYIGELDGCCGCESMHELLDSDWEPVASHRPVQWWGLHDQVIAYDRKA